MVAGVPVRAAERAQPGVCAPPLRGPASLLHPRVPPPPCTNASVRRRGHLEVEAAPRAHAPASHSSTACARAGNTCLGGRRIADRAGSRLHRSASASNTKPPPLSPPYRHPPSLLQLTQRPCCGGAAMARVLVDGVVKGSTRNPRSNRCKPHPQLSS